MQISEPRPPAIIVFTYALSSYRRAVSTYREMADAINVERRRRELEGRSEGEEQIDIVAVDIDIQSEGDHKHTHTHRHTHTNEHTADPPVYTAVLEECGGELSREIDSAAPPLSYDAVIAGDTQPKPSSKVLTGMARQDNLT